MVEQLLVNGLLTGLVYALTALGLALVFGVMRIFNLAHGAFYALGSFLTYSLVAGAGFNVWTALPVVMLFSFALGLLVEHTLVGPVRGHPLAVTVLTLGLAVLAEQVFQAVWGASFLSLPAAAKVLARAGFKWDVSRLAAGAAALFLTGLTAAGLRTRLGTLVRFTAQDPEGAQLAGINTGRVQMLVFGLSAALAAAAGNLTATWEVISPGMGRLPLVVSLAVVIVGGPGNIQATLGAGVVLGLVTTLAGYYLAPQWSYLAALAAIVAALLIRPAGLGGSLGIRD